MQFDPTNIFPKRIEGEIYVAIKNKTVDGLSTPVVIGVFDNFYDADRSVANAVHSVANAVHSVANAVHSVANAVGTAPNVQGPFFIRRKQPIPKPRELPLLSPRNIDNF